MSNAESAFGRVISGLAAGAVGPTESAFAQVVAAAPGGAPSRANRDADRAERKFADKYPGLIARLPVFWDDRGGFTLWNFAVDSSDLIRFDGVLANFGSFFEDLRDRGFNVDIVGVASVSGTDAHNMNLSAARALAVSSLYERRFQMPAGRLNVRQVGSRNSVPPADVQEQFKQLGEDDEATWRAWNRRVELHAVAGEPWTDDVFTRIATALGAPTAPVRHALERTRALQLLELLKKSQIDDLYVRSYDALTANINWFWNKNQTYNQLLMTPARWDMFTFAGHMRDDLARAARPAAADDLLVMHLLGMLRAMNEAWAQLDRYVTVQQEGGSGAAIHVVIQRAYTWIGQQIANDDSVYSVLRPQ